MQPGICKDMEKNPADLEGGQHCPVDAPKYHQVAQPIMTS